MQEKQKILMVDDEQKNLRRAEEILEKAYQLVGVSQGQEALEYLCTQQPALILLDIVMPKMSGYEVVKQIKRDKRMADIPIIFLTGNVAEAELLEGFQIGCADYIRKPFEPDIMRSKIATQLELYGYRHRMEEMLAQEKKKVAQVTIEAITAITKAQEAKDSYTNKHSERVAGYCVQIAEKLGWTIEEIEHLRNLALLHDIGKIGIPDRILNKHKDLSEREYEQMKQHVKIGNDILKNFTVAENLFEGARFHHERWDGSGYLAGLKGEEIPISARIIAVADAYDAMASDRIYRGVMDETYTINELKKGSGRQFDPKIVQIMLKVIEEHR